MGNPVTHKPQYRFYVIFKLPHVRVLDYRRIKQSVKKKMRMIIGQPSGRTCCVFFEERDTAKVMFKGRKGKELRAEVVRRTKNFEVEPSPEDNRPLMNGRPLPSADIQRIKVMYNNTSDIVL